MDSISRRTFLTSMSFGAAAFFAGKSSAWAAEKSRPNIILCMADDLGWGDVAYNGHPAVRTPNLDDMAASGVRFDRFYSGAPVCSPTRGSCLTGRHPFRYGIFSANIGHLRAGEINLAEILGGEGYAIGHFGKWHLGTLTKTVKDSNRGGPEGVEHYMPPWDAGFETCFSSEAKVPTWDPMVVPEQAAGGVRKGQRQGDVFGTFYWSGPGERVRDNLAGDDSRVIMDRAIPFIRQAAADETPFFAVIWFHTPHLPVLAGPEYQALYEGYSERERHYYGCISAMDEQVGRLRTELEKLGVRENTMLCFTSDNGPEWQQAGERACGSAGPFRERKRSLYEGGVRVPGIIEWPRAVTTPKTVDTPCSTEDYFPTVLDALGIRNPVGDRPVDGVSLLPFIRGESDERPRPIAFQTRQMYSLNDNRYKLVSPDKGASWELYDIVADPRESIDLANELTDIVQEMRGTFETWRRSCEMSLNRKDYK